MVLKNQYDFGGFVATIQFLNETYTEDTCTVFIGIACFGSGRASMEQIQTHPPPIVQHSRQ
jgi:hypothetical protein